MTADPRCGTEAGYKAHRRAGDSACVICLKAHSAYTNAHRAPRPYRKRKKPSRIADQLPREVPDHAFTRAEIAGARGWL